MNAKQALAEAKKQLKAAGFEARYVSANENEDGIGACAGQNFIKDGVWYSDQQAMKAVGLVIVASNPENPAKQKRWTLFSNATNFESYMQYHKMPVEFSIQHA